jgi:hypothetical protein
MGKEGSRKHAQLLKRIWRDPHWKSLPVDAQWLYEALISQDTTNFAGVIPLTDRKWSNLADDMTRNRIEAALNRLERERFILIDWDTEEVLIRTYVRNDELWRQPRMMRLALGQAEELQSETLRMALSDELVRLVPMVANASASGVPESAWPELATQTQSVANALVKGLEHLGNPRQNLGVEQDPPGGGSNGAGVVSSNHIHRHQAPSTDTAHHEFPPEPPIDNSEPIEIGTNARPTKPAKPSSPELSFIRLHVGQQLPRDIEAQLVTEVRKLSSFDRPVIESALQNWATRDCSPKLLSNLVSDELKRRRRPAESRTLTTRERNVIEGELLKDNPDPHLLAQYGINPSNTPTLKAIPGGIS